jgi:hypothetical protein
VAQADARPLERATAWAGLHAGDPVAVEGVKGRGTRWAFVAHVRNTDTGAEWVEVVGGRPGKRTVRSFRPEQVFPPSARRGSAAPGAASLADAPQLPL